MHRSTLSFLLAATLLAGKDASLQGVRTMGTIQLDGRLDEADWQEAAVASDFTQSQPHYGAPSRLRTEVRVLYDDHYLYVGMRMQNAPLAKVLAPLFRRDTEGIPTDWVNVQIDSLLSRRRALVFAVSASGVQSDGMLHSDTEWDANWDGVWEAATSINAHGWSAEFKIPLSLLPMKSADQNRAWGINFERYCPEIQETSGYQVSPREENAKVSRYPLLTGVEGIRPQPRREFIPFFLAQRKFETSESFDDRKWKLDTGFDSHLSLGSSAQLDLSVRPDYAQVEVDQAVLNLSAIETVLPEKRPFFLEGMDIFVVPGIQVFYSRRFGKALGVPLLEAGETMRDHPLTVDIAGAAKLMGTTDGGLRYATLGAVTEQAKAEIQTADGRIEQRTLAPQTADGVVRVQQSLGDTPGYVGAFLSTAHNSERSANTSALDATFSSLDRSTRVDAQATFSRIDQRGESRKDGHGFDLRLLQKWKHGYEFFSGAWYISPDFDSNDLGYVDRAFQKGIYARVTKLWDQPFGSFNSASLQFYGQHREDLSNVNLDRNFGGRLDLNLKNNWILFATGKRALASEDDLELRTLKAPQRTYLHRPPVSTLGVGLAAPNTFLWRPQLELERSWRDGGPTDRISLSQGLRPIPPLSFDLITTYLRARGETAYFDTIGGHPIAGSRKLNQLDLVARASYAFSPTLTLQVFSQWMDFAWSYRDLHTYTPAGPLQPYEPTGTPATSHRLWNLNLITRWEFRPGSTAYLVYNHGVQSDALLNDQASIRPFRDLVALRHLPSDDVVQLKMSWLFR